MRWSRIKNIIILLLVIVNVFLLALVGIRAWRTEQGDRETRERMIQVLANNGIQYLPGEVPGAMPLTGRQVTAGTPGEAQAAALVGAVRSVETAGSRTGFTGERGTVIFSASGELEAEFDAAELTQGSLGAAGRPLLEQLGIEVRLMEERAAAPGRRARYVQYWNGALVPALELTLTCAPDGSAALSGRFLTGSEQELPPEETITASTALVRFLKALNDEGYVCSQVTNLYAGYTVSGSGTVSLTPAWFVETDAWPWRFAVDGYTGVVTAAE